MLSEGQEMLRNFNMAQINIYLLLFEGAGFEIWRSQVQILNSATQLHLSLGSPEHAL